VSRHAAAATRLVRSKVGASCLSDGGDAGGLAAELSSRRRASRTALIVSFGWIGGGYSIVVRRLVERNRFALSFPHHDRRPRFAPCGSSVASRRDAIEVGPRDVSHAVPGRRGDQAAWSIPAGSCVGGVAPAPVSDVSRRVGSSRFLPRRAARLWQGR
jgi:hypothetical protein